MPLIKDNDIVTFRKYVKINFTSTPVKSLPDFDAVERKFIVPILTQPVFDALQSQVDSNNITWTSLLNICRAAAAPLAVWLDLPFYQAQLSDSGLKSDEDAAHQWEYVRIENALVNKGMAALEDLIEHLIANAETYTWTNAETNDSFFRTGKDFSRFVFLHQPNLTFQQLKPLIREVEDHFIKPSIGDFFFKQLRYKKNPCKKEKIAIQLIKKTIAQFTVVRAVERMPVKITPTGLMASLQNNSDATNPEKPAEGTALDRLMKSAQREGDSYQVQLMKYLNETASASVFTTFFESEYYTAPAVEEIDPNYYRTGVVAL